MKKPVIKFTLYIAAIAVLTFMLWMPHLEGRNVDATLFQIYFNDPFLAYVYIASIPFFIAIYQAITFVDQPSVKALRAIKLCAISLIGLIVGAEAYFFTVMRGSDDITGGVMMGFVLILISTTAAITAAVHERKLTINK